VADPVVEHPSTDAPPRRRSPVREFAPTALLALVVLSGADEDAGFILTLLSPFLLLWFMRVAWVAWRQPARRRMQLIKLGVIAALVLGVSLVQVNFQRGSHAQAQKVVDAVAAYRAQHGSYPEDLAQVGLDDEALRRDWKVRYWAREGQHRVIYAATFSVYDSFVYDFDKPGWIYSAE